MSWSNFRFLLSNPTHIFKIDTMVTFYGSIFDSRGMKAYLLDQRSKFMVITFSVFGDMKLYTHLKKECVAKIPYLPPPPTRNGALTKQNPFLP